MNFRLILILAIGTMLFGSLICFGIIFYRSYNSDETGKKLFADVNWLHYINFGVLTAGILLNGLLFLKR